MTEIYNPGVFWEVRRVLRCCGCFVVWAIASCQFCDWNTFTDSSADFMQVCVSVCACVQSCADDPYKSLPRHLAWQCLHCSKLILGLDLSRWPVCIVCDSVVMTVEQENKKKNWDFFKLWVTEISYYITFFVIFLYFFQSLWLGSVSSEWIGRVTFTSGSIFIDIILSWWNHMSKAAMVVCISFSLN